MGLYETIQKAAGAAWSAGVEMARAGAAIPDRADDDGQVFQVLPAGAIKPFEVYLWAEDEDWSCSCKDANRPGAPRACAHVVAAVLTARRGAEGQAPARTDVGRVGYRLRRERDPARPERVTLSLERVIHRGGRDLPLGGTLSQATAKGQLLLTDADLAVEDLALRGLYGFRTARGPVPRELAPQLLARLGECPDLTLDGAPIRCSGELILPRALVEDAAEGGFRLRLVRDARIEEVLGGGVVRCGETLHPTSDGGLDADQRQTLSRGVSYMPEQVSRLVSEAIPRLRQKIPVEIRTKRLPQTGATPPRVLLEVSGVGETLVVLPSLVYGDPPSARLERGQLQLLGGPVPVRDEAAERKLIEGLRAELGLSPGLRDEVTGEDAVRLADRMRNFSGGAVVGDGLSRFRKVGALEPDLRLDGDRFDVSFAANGGGSADPGRVLRAWREGRGLVPLTDGGWATLPRGWLEQYGHLLADLLDARDPSGKVAKHALFDLGRLCDALELPPPPTLAGLRALAKGFEGLPEAPLPADLRAELRPYQRVGVNWLSFLRQAGMGGILADDMGLGKTLQTLCVLGPGTLVVAPTSVIPNWAAEARKFRPGLRVNVYHGSSRRLDESADLTLTSYALLRLDADLLTARRWQTVVLDEAQNIKNPDSQVARVAYKLQAELRLTLTGTPVENRLEELWSQLHFLNPGLLGGRTDFDARYGSAIVRGEAGAANRLRARIRPFVLRRMKSEVARDLPPRTDITLRTPLSESERAVYDTIRAATKKELVAKLAQGGGVMAALEALLRLRQAACHPALVPGQKARSSSKLELLAELLDEAVSEGHKALVFSQWTSLLDLVEPVLKEAGIAFTRLDGSTRDRGAVVAHFQSAEGPPVLLVSLKAGGTGLNLTAADHVFLLDPWWNPAVEEQAADRAHRIGQERPVMVYRLLAEDTVETRIEELKERKRALSDAALGDAAAAAAITREDLLALLG